MKLIVYCCNEQCTSELSSDILCRDHMKAYLTQNGWNLYSSKEYLCPDCMSFLKSINYELIKEEK